MEIPHFTISLFFFIAIPRQKNPNLMSYPNGTLERERGLTQNSDIIQSVTKLKKKKEVKYHLTDRPSKSDLWWER